jgi:hypothetical protein
VYGCPHYKRHTLLPCGHLPTNLTSNALWPSLCDATTLLPGMTTMRPRPPSAWWSTGGRASHPLRTPGRPSRGAGPRRPQALHPRPDHNRMHFVTHTGKLRHVCSNPCSSSPLRGQWLARRPATQPFVICPPPSTPSQSRHISLPPAACHPFTG